MIQTIHGILFHQQSVNKETERFKAVYPTLKKVVLAGSTGSKAMKQVSQQISKSFMRSVPDSSKSQLLQTMGDLEASIVVLRKLAAQWKVLSLNQSSLEAFTKTQEKGSLCYFALVYFEE